MVRLNGVSSSYRTRSRRAALGAMMIAIVAAFADESRGQQPTPAAVPPGPETVSPDVFGRPTDPPFPNGPRADALTGPIYEGDSRAEFANLPVGPGMVEGMCPMPSPWRCGVYCGTGGACNNQTWEDVRPIPWQVFAQGEYIGPARMRHVPEYRLRVGDQLGLVFRLTTIPSVQPYQLTVGDEVTIESLTSDDVQRSVIIQPDGTITLRLLGQVKVAGRSIEEVRNDLDEALQEIHSRSVDYGHADQIKHQAARIACHGRRPAGPGRSATSGQGHTRRDDPVTWPGLGPDARADAGRIEAQSRRSLYATRRRFEVTPIFWNGPRAMSSSSARCAARPLRVDRPDDPHAIDCLGRRMERGRQRQSRRRVPPGRVLEPDGHAIDRV